MYVLGYSLPSLSLYVYVCIYCEVGYSVPSVLCGLEYVVQVGHVCPYACSLSVHVVRDMLCMVSLRHCVGWHLLGGCFIYVLSCALCLCVWVCTYRYCTHLYFQVVYTVCAD
jgi:hypothetical protein